MIKEFTCQICHQIYSNPITLNCCGENVCKKHVEKIISSNQFTCLLCHEENYNQNLKVNKFIEKLIAKDLHKYEIDLKYQEKLINLENETLKIVAILNNHDKVIHEEISELKRQVDLEREILKSQIDERADDLIQQLESYEAKFKTEYKTIVDFEHYISLVESSRKKLEEYESCLNLFSAKHQEREEKYIENENMIKNLQAEIVELNNRLVSNLSITYKPFKGNMKDLYGQIITKVSKSII
jgi:hypothetical protein